MGKRIQVTLPDELFLKVYKHTKGEFSYIPEYVKGLIRNDINNNEVTITNEEKEEIMRELRKRKKKRR